MRPRTQPIRLMTRKLFSGSVGRDGYNYVARAGAAGGNTTQRIQEQRLMSQLLDIARERIVIYDGSMGATILNMQLSAEDYGGLEGCNENLVFVNPGIVEGIHASYMEVGCDVLETDTFGGSQIKLEEYGLGERTYEQNRLAA